MKPLDLNKLNNKKCTIISSEEALKDVTPINWFNENTQVYCTNCVNFKPIDNCKTNEKCKNCICDLCCCDDPEDSMSFLERPLYVPKN